MKLKYVLLFFSLVFISGAKAQSEVEKPDFDAIASIVNDKNSASYYPRLMERFMANDSTLLLEDYRNLYYGFAMQEDYNPYRISPFAKKVNEYSSAESLDGAQCDSIIKYSTLAIGDFPFDTRSMNMLIYAFQNKGLAAQQKIWTDKLRNIIDAVLSSGDGLSEDSPYYVIYAPHEYELINLQGLTAKKQVLANAYTDYVTVEPNDFDVTGFYFNISKLLEAYKLKFE